LNPLSMVFWPPYPWYIEPMVFRSSYPWYFDSHTHGILTPFHGILTPLPMVFWPPTHDILTPYPWYINPSLLVEMRRVNLPWGGSKYNDEKSTQGQYIIWKLTMGSIYHGGQNIIWQRAWWISVPNHDNIFIWTF
jgi:hypothetical protein